MSKRITDIQKQRLNVLTFEFGVRIERSMNGFKVLGLNNGTEPRAKDLDEAIDLAERETKRIYAKYLQNNREE